MITAVRDTALADRVEVFYWAVLVGPDYPPRRRGLDPYPARLPLLRLQRARRSSQERRPRGFYWLMREYTKGKRAARLNSSRAR